jgi:chromosome partitioning protein
MATAVVACYAVKGGVGKTSAAVNLAYCAARDGSRTLLWDLDPQAAASFLLRTKPRVKGGVRKLLQGRSDPHDAIRATAFARLEVLPAQALYDSADVDLQAAKKSERRVERVLEPLLDDYDVVILDCPPGMSLLATNVVRAARLLLVPIVPSPLSLRTLDQVVDQVNGSDTIPPQVLAFLSMVDARRALHRDVAELIGAKYGDVAGVTVPASATVERMGQRRAPVAVFAPKSVAARSYDELWAEVAARVRLTAPVG